MNPSRPVRSAMVPAGFRSWSRGCIIVMLVVAVVAGCSAGSSSGGAADDDQAEAVRAARQAPLFRGTEAKIVAIDNEFVPEVFKVEAGTEVTFTNEGRLRHDVIPVTNGDFEIPLAEFEPGDAQSFVLSDAGTFRYYCSIHGTPTSGMIGTLAVVK